MQMKYVSVKEMVAIEKAADQAGHSYAAMMEEAGRGLAEVIHHRYGDISGKRVLALVGSGNNGGDALVALDYLLQWGWDANALILRRRSPDDSLVQRVVERGAGVREASAPGGYSGILNDELKNAAVLIDGVLGTGIKLPLREPLGSLLGITRQVLSGMEHPPVVVAVDCPSGVDCDSGEADQRAIQADLTVCMAAVKEGMLKFPAYGFVGEIVTVDIGIPQGVAEWDGIKREIILKEWVRANLPPRPLDAHKGTFGTALILAGSRAYPGAAVLAGRSAYRIGTGLVTMAVPESIYPGLMESFPEATWVVLEEEEDGIQESSIEKVKTALKRSTACLIGPGWGKGRSTGHFLASFLEIASLPPLVIDADGLRLLSELREWSRTTPPGSVLTPHPGEMAVLCGLSVADIQADRVGTAERFAREWNQIVLLKGAHTVIAAPDGETRILISANPALAKAGSGDVLSGMITGLIAQGMAPFSAAAAGAWLHARAGTLAASRAGSPAALLAGEISGMIGETLAELTSRQS